MADVRQAPIPYWYNAIANIEVWAETNSWTEVDVAHVKGKPLCTDFTGHIAANKGV